MKRSLLILLFLALAVAGCRDHFLPVDPTDPADPNPSGDPLKELRDVQWKLVAFENADGSVDKIPPTVGATIIFDATGNAHGSTGCNSFGGEYSAGADGSISITSMIYTEVYCMQYNWVETRCLGGLQSARRYSITSGELRIYDDKGNALFYNLTGPDQGTPSADSVMVDLDQAFKLRVGETASVKGENLWLQFPTVLEDSRCPTGANCLWEGNGRVALAISDGVVAAMVELNTTLEPKRITFGNYQVELLELNPYPVMDRGIGLNDYVVTLRVTKN